MAARVDMLFFVITKSCSHASKICCCASAPGISYSRPTGLRGLKRAVMSPPRILRPCGILGFGIIIGLYLITHEFNAIYSRSLLCGFKGKDLYTILTIAESTYYDTVVFNGIFSNRLPVAFQEDRTISSVFDMWPVLFAVDENIATRNMLQIVLQREEKDEIAQKTYRNVYGTNDNPNSLCIYVLPCRNELNLVCCFALKYDWYKMYSVDILHSFVVIVLIRSYTAWVYYEIFD